MPHVHLFAVPAKFRVKSLNVWGSVRVGQPRSRLNTSAEEGREQRSGQGHIRGAGCGSRPRPAWLRKIHRGLFTAATCLLQAGRDPGGEAKGSGGDTERSRQGGGAPGRCWGGGCARWVQRCCRQPRPRWPPLGRGPSRSGRVTSVSGFCAVFRQGKGAGEGGSGPPGGAPSCSGRGREPMGAGAAVWQAGRPLPPPGGEPARRRLAASSAAAGLTHASILLSPGSRSHAPRRGRSGARGAAADKAKMAGILAWFWNERFWLPHNVTWADLQSTEEAAFPQAEDLYLAFPLAFCIFMIRLLFER